MPEPEDDVDAVFAALADPTRRRLLDQLSASGPQSASQLARDYPVTRQAVVKHLGALSSAGLLTSQRYGREVRYGVVTERLQEASAWLAEVGQRWDDRLGHLTRQLSLARLGPQPQPPPPRPASGTLRGDQNPTPGRAPGATQ